MSVLLNSCTRIVVVWVAILVIASNASTQPSPPTETIREKTEDVFKRPEFQRKETKKKDVRSGQVKSEERTTTEPQRQENQNRESQSAREESTPQTESGGTGLLGLGLLKVVFIILAVAFVVFMIVKIFKNRVPADSNSVDKKNEELAIVVKRAWLSENYRAQARHLADSGDYIEAIRFLFLALVYRFDESGKVSFHKEYTNREYLDLLSDRRNVGDLRLIVDVLDDYWYGQHPCQREQYDECVRVYERLVS